MVMERAIKFLDTDYVVDFDYKITSHGSPAHIGSLTYPGDPGDPMEYEIKLESLRYDVPCPHRYPDESDYEFMQRMDDFEKITAPLEVPAWLRSRIETFLECDGDTSAAIEEASWHDYDGDY